MPDRRHVHGPAARSPRRTDPPPHRRRRGAPVSAPRTERPVGAACRRHLADRLHADGQLTRRRCGQPPRSSLGRATRNVLQGGEVAIEFTAYPALDERPGELEKAVGLALHHNPDTRPLAGWFDRLFDVERHRAGRHLKYEPPWRFVLLDPYRRLHPPAEELAHLSAGGACLGRGPSTVVSMGLDRQFFGTFAGSVAYAKTSSGGRSITTDASTLINCAPLFSTISVCRRGS